MKKTTLVLLIGLLSNLSFGQKITTSAKGDTVYVQREINVTPFDDVNARVLKFDTVMLKISAMTFEMITAKGYGATGGQQLWYKKHRLNLVYHYDVPNCPYNITKIYFKSFENITNPALVLEGGCFIGSTEEIMYFMYVPEADVFTRLGLVTSK